MWYLFYYTEPHIYQVSLSEIAMNPFTFQLMLLDIDKPTSDMGICGCLTCELVKVLYNEENYTLILRVVNGISINKR